MQLHGLIHAGPDMGLGFFWPDAIEMNKFPEVIFVHVGGPAI